MGWASIARPMLRLVFLMLVALSTTALSANPKASALAKEADRLYKDDRYKEAAETLRQAYDAEATPLYLYNIARAYEQAGELELSQEHYRRYLGLPAGDTQPDLVKKANLAMDRLRTLLARAAAQRSTREGEKQKLEEDARQAEARADAEASDARRQRRELEAKEKDRKQAEEKKLNVRKLGTLIAGGGAALGLGMALGLGVASNVNRDAFRKATTLPDKQRLEAETRGTAAGADLCLVIGLAAAVTTVVLFPKGEALEGSLSVALSPLPGGGGLASVGARF